MKLKIIEIPSHKNFRYFWIFFCILFISQLVSAALANYINPDLTNTKLQFDSLWEEFFVVVVIAPVIETVIFQYAFIETLANLKVKAWICIVTSALLFGALHWHNPVYVMVTTVVGFIIAYYYMALRKQKGLNGIMLLIAIYALFNALAFILKNFSKLL